MGSLFRSFVFFTTTALSLAQNADKVFQFPSGIAVKDMATLPNGRLVFTAQNSPILYVLSQDLNPPKLNTLGTFDGSITGLKATTNGSYAFLVGDNAPTLWNMSPSVAFSKIGGPYQNVGHLDSLSIHQQVLSIDPIAGAVIGETTIVASDSSKGVIYKLDKSNQAKVFVDQGVTKSGAINAILGSLETIYFTSRAQGQLLGVSVHEGNATGPFVYGRNISNAKYFAISWTTSGELRRLKRQDPFAPDGIPAAFFFNPNSDDVQRVSLNVLVNPTLHARVPGGPMAGTFGNIKGKDDNVMYVATKSGGLYKTYIKIYNPPKL